MGYNGLSNSSRHDVVIYTRQRGIVDGGYSLGIFGLNKLADLGLLYAEDEDSHDMHLHLLIIKYTILFYTPFITEILYIDSTFS